MTGRTKRRQRETPHHRLVTRLSRSRVYRYALTLAIAALLFSPIAMVTIPMPDIRLLGRENPQTTDLILRRATEGGHASPSVTRMQSWVSLEEISPYLRRAVVLCEEKTVREKGWFTIPWQGNPLTRSLARNLFFSGENSIARRAAIAITAYRMERILSRERILEIYLNVAEWGKGIYGAEAAAEHYFRKGAVMLKPREAALLACSLHSPGDSNPAAPGRELSECAGRTARLLTEKGAPARTGAPQ